MVLATLAETKVARLPGRNPATFGYGKLWNRAPKHMELSKSLNNRIMQFGAKSFDSLILTGRMNTVG